jgi:hypothetical protein
MLVYSFITKKKLNNNRFLSNIYLYFSNSSTSTSTEGTTSTSAVDSKQDVFQIAAKAQLLLQEILRGNKLSTGNLLLPTTANNSASSVKQEPQQHHAGQQQQPPSLLLSPTSSLSSCSSSSSSNISPTTTTTTYYPQQVAVQYHHNSQLIGLVQHPQQHLIPYNQQQQTPAMLAGVDPGYYMRTPPPNLAVQLQQQQQIYQYRAHLHQQQHQQPHMIVYANNGMAYAVPQPQPQQFLIAGINQHVVAHQPPVNYQHAGPPSYNNRYNNGNGSSSNFYNKRKFGEINGNGPNRFSPHYNR